jgi:glucoamylase
MIIEHRYIF